MACDKNDISHSFISSYQIDEMVHRHGIYFTHDMYGSIDSSYSKKDTILNSQLIIEHYEKDGTNKSSLSGRIFSNRCQSYCENSKLQLA